MSSGFFTILSEKCSVALWNLKRACKSCWIQIHFILWRKNATCSIRRLNEITWKKQWLRCFWHLEEGRLRAKSWAYKIIVTRRVKHFVFYAQVECQYSLFIIQIQFQNLWLVCILRHHSYISRHKMLVCLVRYLLLAFGISSRSRQSQNALERAQWKHQFREGIYKSN